MKKLKKLFTLFLLAFICIHLLQCDSSDEYLETEEYSSSEIRKTQRISMKELPNNLSLNVERMKTFSRDNRSDFDDIIIFDESQVIELIDAYDNIKYSVKFNIADQEQNVLYNLILGYSSDMQETTPYIVKYTIENLDEVYSEDSVDFTKMEGKLTKFTLNNFLNFLENRTTQDTDPTVVDNPCPDHTINNPNNNTGNTGSNNSSGSGPGGSNNHNPNDPGNYDYGDNPSGGGDLENPEDENIEDDCSYLFWSNGETGEIFGISWSCSNGNTGYGDLPDGDRTSNEDTDCPRDEDIAINDGRDEFAYSPDVPIVDITDFLKCFNSSQPATLTVYVKEPNPGSGDSYSGFGYVGHAYVSITQGSEVSTFGFYPTSDNINPVNTTSTSVLGNDGSESFTASISTTITGAQLQLILNASINFNGTYDLDNYNCTDFAIELGNLGGLGLPEANGTWPGGGGSNPGALGLYIHNFTPAGGINTNTTAGSSPASNQGC